MFILQKLYQITSLKNVFTVTMKDVIINMI